MLLMFVVLCRPFRRRAKYLTRFELSRDNVGLGGAAMLKDKIYIVKKQCITVYSSNTPFMKIKYSKIKELINPWDVAACDLNNYVYVLDIRSASVWRVSDDLSISELISVIPNARLLSISSNGEIVISDTKTIDVYNSTGTKLTSVVLHYQMTNISCIRQSPRGTFYVSHCGSTGMFRISEMFKNGEVFRSFIGLKESKECGKNKDTIRTNISTVSKHKTDTEIIQPCNSRKEGRREYQSYNVPIILNKDGRLIVLDNCNSRILLLDSKLNLQRILMSFADNDQPNYGYRSMTYEETSGCILLDNLVDRSVQMYKLHQNIKPRRF